MESDLTEPAERAGWALITGGAVRLGRAIALELAGAGLDVVVHYHRSAEAAEETVAHLRARGVAAQAVCADLADPEAAARLMEAVGALAGPVDVLVNSASIFPSDRFGDHRLTDLHRNLQVNALAPLALIRAFAAQGRSGQVINLLDTRVAGADPIHFSYGLSKKLLHAVTRELALELAPRIRVNGVAPGLVLPPRGEDAAYLAARAREVPLERHGSPADIARAVRFLVESPFITGQVVYVDGGAHLCRRTHA
jgi:NAD(P)-dependent dehydrogenase (short-subunit alcohol dehydrogenase family)